MKTITAFLLLFTLSAHQYLLHGQAGALDPSFSMDGLLTTDIAFSTYDEANAVALQPDGAILAAGTSGYSGTQDFAVVRYLADGTVDATFGNGGRAVLSIVPGDDIATAMALQADGRIVVGGYVYDTGGIAFGIARFHADGTTDSTFGINGSAITLYPGDVTSQARAVAVQPDGKILLAGGGTAGFAIVRYHIDGSVDSTFGTNGLVTVDFSQGNDQATAMAVQPDDKILLAGYASGLVADSIALARLNPDGSPDGTFGTGGTTRASYPTVPSVGRGLALMPDGRFVVSGNAEAKAIIGRFHADGQVDASFNAFGFVRFTIPGTVGSNAYAAAVQPDGKVLGAGVAYGTTNDFLLVRLNADGSADNTFDGDGIVTTDFAANLDAAAAMALQPNGAIVLAGETNGGPQDYDFALARYLGDLGVGITGEAAGNGSLRVFPMPMVASSVIHFDLDAEDLISIDLLDARGALVRSVVDRQRRGSGTHVVALGVDAALAPGVYSLQLRGRSLVRTAKVIVDP